MLKNIIENISESFDSGKNKIFLNEQLELILLPFGQSQNEQKKNNQIIVYQDIFLKNQTFYKSLLKSKLNLNETLFARDAHIGTISKEIFNSFCHEYHYLKGANCKVRYGLFINNELVMVAGFSKPRKMFRQGNKFSSAELIRSATKYGITISGGLSKTISKFRSEYAPDDIVTYIDKDFFDGNSYLKLGFKLYKELPPITTWLNKTSGFRYTTDQLIKNKIIDRKDLERHNYTPKDHIPMINQGVLKLVNEFY